MHCDIDYALWMYMCHLQDEFLAMDGLVLIMRIHDDLLYINPWVEEVEK